MRKLNQKMVTAGNKIASNLMDATCEYTLCGMGGCRDFKLENFPAENRELIWKYLQKEIDSVEAIYLAMKRHDTLRARFKD
jgi:hypothetical protein